MIRAENANTLVSIEAFQKAWNIGKGARNKHKDLGLSLRFTTSDKPLNHFEPQFSHLEDGG